MAGHGMEPDRTGHCSIGSLHHDDVMLAIFYSMCLVQQMKQCKGMLTAACKKFTCLPQHAEDKTKHKLLWLLAPNRSHNVLTLAMATHLTKLTCCMAFHMGCTVAVSS